jgi:integrase/recombinase XerD
MSDLIPIHLMYLRAGGYAERTVVARERLLYHAHSCLPYGLDQADRNEIAAYLQNPAWSTWTRSTYWSHLYGYYVWAYEADELTCNPMVGLIRPPAGQCVPDPVSDEELARALWLSPDQPWRMAIMLAAYAGLRGSEIAAIRREDVSENHVRVRKGKGGRDGMVETAPVLWEFVRDRPSGLLVHSVTGRPMSGHRLVAHQAWHWRRIGMPDVHLHRFRHWYGTALMAAGNDARTVQELMRHKSLVSTQGYTQVVSEQRRLAIRTLPTPAYAHQSAA